MKRNTWMSIAAATLATAAAPAPAADTSFYLAASVGQGEEEPHSGGIDIGFPFTGVVHLDPYDVDVDERGEAWSVGSGYRINKYLAAEIEYVSFGTTRVVELYNPGDLFPVPIDIFPRSYSSTVTGPALSLLGSVPFGQRFEVFVRAGVLFADRKIEMAQSDGFDETFGSTAWLGGIGVSWSFGSRWALRGEYQRTGKLDETIVSGETELQKVSLGVRFEL